MSSFGDSKVKGPRLTRAQHEEKAVRILLAGILPKYADESYDIEEALRDASSYAGGFISHALYDLARDLYNGSGLYSFVHNIAFLSLADRIRVRTAYQHYFEGLCPIAVGDNGPGTFEVDRVKVG